MKMTLLQCSLYQHTNIDAKSGAHPLGQTSLCVQGYAGINAGPRVKCSQAEFRKKKKKKVALAHWVQNLLEFGLLHIS